LWGYCTFICILLGGLGTFHAILISRNLTTYEHSKQTYRDKDGVLRNPFDRGLLANWAEVFVPDAANRLIYFTPYPRSAPVKGSLTEML